MSGFLYFIADEVSVKAADLRKLGLDYAFAPGANVACRQAMSGPGGPGGCTAVDSSRVPSHRLGYYPDRQRWQRIPSALLADPEAEVWVGIELADPPQPHELIRVEPLPGHLIRLADGREWLIPVARFWAEADGEIAWGVKLPQVTGLDPVTGDWKQGEIHPRYAGLWSIAQRWWDAMSQAQESEIGLDAVRVEFPFEGLHDAALEVLQANYAVSRAEAVLLGIFTQPTCRSILDALVDWPTLNEWFKKKVLAEQALAGCGPGSGPPA